MMYRIVNVHSEPISPVAFYSAPTVALVAVGLARRAGEIAFITSERGAVLVFPDATEQEVLARLASGPVVTDDAMGEWR